MSSQYLTLYKMIVLYMLKRCDVTLSKSQIYDFILEKEYTTFLTLQEVFSELASSDLITEKTMANRTYLEITEEGTQTLEFFGNRINPAIKQQIDEIRNGTIPRGYKSSVVFIPNEWNVIPLREIVAKVNDLNSGNKITEVFSNSAANGVISQRDYFEKDIANQDNTESYTIVQPDDYIYNPRISNMAPFGPIRKNKLHKTGVVSPLYTVFRQVKKDLVCEYYLDLYLSSSQWYKYVYSVANQGARFDRMNITEGDLLNMPIVYPAIKEQRKIVETLSACDEIIELYKQKTEQLQILKKNLLEKMFPQYGADTPEIRFPGFTDPWEQRKYSDVIDLLSGQDYEPSAYNDERIGIPYMTGASCVIEGKTIVNRWTLTPKCIAYKGDVLLVC